MQWNAKALLISLVTSYSCLAFSGEAMFVQSQKAALKSEPAMNAADVGAVERGDEVQILETKGAWLQVQKGQSKGWISKLFLSKNRPVGAAALANEVPASEAKTSRRRESSYSVSASTRGLMPVERSRNGRESYSADNEALEAVERINLSPNEVEAFTNQAKAQTK